MAKQLAILVAEDEETDVIFLRHALRRAGSTHELIVTQDGKEAIDYLEGQAPYSDRTRYPLPALVLLDLTMPRMTGFEVLAWMQRRPDLKQLPAVVLTSSENEADQQRARALGAADYRVKPPDLTGLVKIVHDLESKWLTRTY
jgi:CheY-like chemotaxis protein